MDNEQEMKPTIGVGNEQAVAESPRISRRARVLRRSAIAALVLVTLFYGAGGWYFSTELGNDAFVVGDPATQGSLCIPRFHQCSPLSVSPQNPDQVADKK